MIVIQNDIDIYKKKDNKYIIEEEVKTSVKMPKFVDQDSLIA